MRVSSVVVAVTPGKAQTPFVSTLVFMERGLRSGAAEECAYMTV